MKYLYKSIFLILTVLLYTSCSDDFTRQAGKMAEGNFVIRLSSGLGTRAEDDDATPGSDRIINPDDNYINTTDDYKFYLFDSTGKCVKEIDGHSSELVRTTIKDSYNTEYMLQLQWEDFSELQILTLANLKGFDPDADYPDFTGKSLEDVYTDMNALFSYPSQSTTDEDGIEYTKTWQPSESANRGIPMFGVSEKITCGGSMEVEIPVIRALAKIEMSYEQDREDITPDDGCFTLFVVNNSAWQQVNVYAYHENDDGTVDIKTPVWPGMEPKGQTVIDGDVYYYYFIPVANNGEELKLIFNNNQGLQILGPQYWKYYTDREYFIELQGDELLDVDWNITSRYEHDGRTVYVIDHTGWDEVYMYVYDAEANVDLPGLTWPGLGTTGKEMINGQRFLFFDLGNIDSGTAKFMFNNGTNTLKTEETASDPIYDLSKDHYFELFDTYTSFNCEEDGRTVYVKDETGWDNLYLYMYGNINDLGGSWPGKTPDGTTQINGEEYYYFHIPKGCGGKNENLIFHNNQGVQLADYPFAFNSDLYLTIKEGYPVTEIREREETYNEENDKDVKGGYRIYVDDQTGWDDLALYMWGDKEFYGGWPGKEPAGSITINGTEYKYFDIPSDGVISPRDEDPNYKAPLNENIIFNDNGGGSQLADVNFTFERDLFLKLETTGATELGKPEGFEPTYMVYVENGTPWNEMYLYMYSAGEGGVNDWTGGWPGIKGYETVKNGKTYLAFQLPYGSKGLIEYLIFNNGQGDQVESNYYFVINGDLYVKVQKQFQVVEYPVHDEFIIGVRNNVGWETVNVYSYTDGGAELFGTWSGLTPTSSEADNSYFSFVIDDNSDYKASEVADKETYLIFNDSKSEDEGGHQVDYYSLEDPDEGDVDKKKVPTKFKFDCDLFVVITPATIEGAAVKEITKPEEEDKNVKWVRLTYFNSEGSLIPDLSNEENSDWDKKGVGVSTPTLNALPAQEVNLQFVKDQNTWVAYLPEMDLREARPQVELALKAFDAIIPFDLKNYNTGSDELNYILRNNVYRYKVEIKLQNITVKYTVCPWGGEGQTSGEIRFE